MADRASQNLTKLNSAKRRDENGKGSKNSSVGKSNRDLLSREEEYKLLNEALEARTENLVREAEQVIRQQDSLLSKTSLLDNINTEDFLHDFDGSEADTRRSHNIEEDESLVTALHSRPRSSDKMINKGPSRAESSSSSRPSSSRPVSKVSNQNRQQKGQKSHGKGSGAPRAKSNLAVDDVAVPEEAFLTEYKDSLHTAIAGIEGRYDKDDVEMDDIEDVMPSAAAEMGAEAQMRFLKAKLRVMQEELDRLGAELTIKEEEVSKLRSRLKEGEDERGRLQRTTSSQQAQMDKYKRLAEDARGKADSLDTQLAALKKELETMKRNQKQQASTQNATDVRLNRALEDIERYKSQVQKTKLHSKESTEVEKKRIEQLMADNKRLEKQKNELMTGFKKQLKLIDVLKKQKMHLEAAKMLSFTEEEFVKALEWGSS